MTKISEPITLSRLNDLKEICSVLGELTSRIGTVECFSWRYPTQRSDTLDIMNIIETHIECKEEFYITLLELICDRFHFLLYLLLGFLDRSCLSLENTEKHKHVKLSRSIPLGMLTILYCERTLQLEQQFLLQMGAVGTEHIMLSPLKQSTLLSRLTQTEQHSLVVCESCHLAEGMVKNLVDVIEKYAKSYNISSHVGQMRLKVKNKIFRMTQWDVMNVWITAILKDVDGFNQVLQSCHKSNENLQKLLKNTKASSEKDNFFNKNRITALENNIMQLKKTYLDEEAKYKITLQTKYDILIKQRKEDCVHLETKLKERDEKNTLLQKYNETLRDEKSYALAKLKLTSEEVDAQKNEAANWRERWAKDEKVKDVLKEQLTQNTNQLEKLRSELECKVTTLREKEIKMVEDKNMFSNELEHLNKTLLKKQRIEEELNEKVRDLQQKLKDMGEREVMLLQYPDLNGNLLTPTCKGDPMEDMKGQLKANKVRIKLLGEHNLKLQKTLDKMKSFNLIKH